MTPNESTRFSVTAGSTTRGRPHVLSLPDSVSEGESEPSTKLTVGPLLFERLRGRGYRECSSWLAKNRDGLGVRSTVDIESRYLAPTGGGRGSDVPRQQPD